jgi:hypothetical protein
LARAIAAGKRRSRAAVTAEAFALLGILFVLAYPHYFTRLALFVVITAMGLEALQHLTPDSTVILQTRSKKSLVA